MSDDPTRVDRRRFLKVVGVSGAGAAALSGCSTDRVQKLIPYLVQSEDQVPGIPTYYASTCTECAAGCGLHVKTREGRAIKLEGNPEHPVNAGTICARGQAGLQGLYNPGRLRFPMARNAAGQMAEILWSEGIDRLSAAVGGARGRVAILSGTGRGTLDDLLEQFAQGVGGRLVRYEPFDHEPLRAANERVFGTAELAAHDFGAARYILSFGADFLETWLAPVENQRGFAKSHGFDGSMAKFTYVGPRMSLTGMNADEWITPRPGSEVSLALGLANAVVTARTDPPADAAALRPLLAQYPIDRVAADTGLPAERIERLAREFAAVSPSLAVAGGLAAQHARAVELCAAVNLLNYVAGNVGRTVLFGPAPAAADGYGAVRDLQRAMEAGAIDVLIVHEANPAFTLPASSGFREALKKVRLTVSTSPFLDETAAAADLLLPNLHALERWDDARPRVGVHGLMQPVMEPVFPNLATGDLVLAVGRKLGLAGFDAASYEAHLKAAWGAFGRSRGATDSIGFWRQALMKGGVYDTVTPRVMSLAPGAATVDATPPALEGDGEYLFLPAASSMYYDGRGANRPWLLENPDPVTKITWTSWVEVHPDTAARLDVREGEIVRLTSPHGSIEAPVYVYAGLRPDVVSAPLGLGHTEYGQFAKGRGANALDLLGPGDGEGFLPYVATRVRIEKTGGYRKLPKTEGNPRELGRHITETMSLAAAAKGLTVEQAYREEGGESHELNPERELEAIRGFRESHLEGRKLGAYAQEFPQWAMVVDLARCTGCSACVTACYAENNIPWVGEENVLKGRELSWMRIERYFHGGEDGEPFSTRVIPVMCQQCDNAPCEPVCPVYAAYHTADGLNGQVYNRCVGTRYCANNCPYKVRYFNWYPFARRAFEPPFNLQLNPDVTVRARGVMEKCTFCVQRIRAAQNQARLEDRPLRDGDVVTACAQACPSGAITFGNVKEPRSRVSLAMKNHRGYHVLEEINVRPAVTYLAKVLDRAEG